MYHIERLDNGLTLVLEPIPYVKSIATGIFVSVGSGHETAEQNGISHFIEHMNFKGTATRSAKDIARVMDSVGGKLNAYTSKEHTNYYSNVLSEHFDMALELMLDIFYNSLYQDAQIETEKRVILEEINMYEDNPGESVHDFFVRNIWPEFNLGQPIIGRREVVESMSRDKIVDYVGSCYVPENIIISVAGNFELTSMKSRLKEAFEHRKSAKARDHHILQPTYKSGINLIQKDTEQVHFCVGGQGISYHDKHRYPLLILSSIFGGSMSSILFQEIREKRGLVYSIFSYPLYFKQAGLFSVYAGTGYKQARDVCQLILDFLSNLKEEVTEDRLSTAKEQLKGNLILNLESTTSKMAWNGKNYFYYQRYLEIDEIIDKINKITLDDLHEMVDYISDPEYYSLTAIGRFETNPFEGLL